MTKQPLWIAICCVHATLAFSQVDYASATLKGTVTDPSGKVIPGARIQATNKDTGVVRSVAATAEGYQIVALQPGPYRVEVSASGFAHSLANGVILSVGETALYDVRLSLGTETTVVEVAADIPVVQPEQTQQSNIIDRAQVENLPNMTRNFVQSIYTLPGVNNAFAPALQNPGVGTGYLSSGFSIGASNGRSNLVTIDGGENDYGSGALRVQHVPVDSIQEFQVNRSSFGAEFGFTIGTAINMVTRGGTNEWHGSASAYFRHRAISARNYFNKIAGPDNDPFEQTLVAGGTLGGAIRKNKLFFFTAPEFQRLDSSSTQDRASQPQFQAVSSQPNGFNGTTCPRQNTPQQEVTQFCYLTQLSNSGGALGALGAGLLASPFFANPLANPALKSMVTANDGTFNGIVAGPAGSGAIGVPGFNTPRGRFANWVSRLDYVPESRDAFSLRVSVMKETYDVKPQPPFSGFVDAHDYTLTGSWTHTSGARIANTLRAQVVPSDLFSIHAPAPNGAEIDLGGQVQLGSPFTFPDDATWRRFQFDDNFSLIKGSHSLKFGGSWRPSRYQARQEVWFGGQWQFTDGAVPIISLVAASAGNATAAALAGFNLSQGYPATGPASTNLSAVQSYLAGAPSVLLQSDPNSNPEWSAWSHEIGLFAQDSWKVSPHLALNYGVRFDSYHDPDPVPASNRFSPRFGFAWDPAGDQKTIIRTGGGLYVAPTVIMVPLYTNLVGTSGKYINQTALVAGLPSPPFPSIFAAWALASSMATPANPAPRLSADQLKSLGVVLGPPGPTAFGNIVYTLGSNFKPAYTIQASASVAREVTRNLSLELSYLMYRSVHIQQSDEVNFVRDLSAPINQFAGPLYVPRPGSTAGEPNSSIFQNNALSSTGSGTYHGGTVSITRRWNRRLQFQANYVFSKAIDNTSDFSALSTAFRPGMAELERAVSNFNITHNFVANAVYTSPSRAGKGALDRLLSDWTVSPILYARSGVPFTLLVPGLANGTIGHSATARPWYEGRNNNDGPAFASWDLRVSKPVIGGEGRVRLDFIAQAQNLLNRTNFASVNTNFPADPNYPLPGGGTLAAGPYRVSGFAPQSLAAIGTPLAYTSAYPARQISLALRLAF